MADADLLADMLASAAAKYDVKEQVGAGGMALVFKARERATGETVAMKVIRPQLLSDGHARELFDREAKVTARLTHRNIVRVREVLPLAHGGQAIVMDFLSGVSLKHHLKVKGPLPFDRALQILTDVAAALQYTHFGGLVHRDVKPENIFLDGKTGQALLTDFGIACSIGVPPSDPRDSTHGTPSYMSPEHIEGRSLDARSDIYSLGCVAYELLTGVPPWSGMTVGEVLERQRKDRIPPVHLLRSDIPAWLEGVISQAVAKHPVERIPDAKSFAEALAPIAKAPSSAARGAMLRQLLGIGVSVIGAVVLYLAGRSDGSVASRQTLMPTETFVQENLLPGGIEETPADTAMVDSPPDLSSPRRDDAIARDLVARAENLDGQPEGFSLILSLERYARSSEVSPQVRSRARAQAVKFRQQCESLAALGGVTCP